VAFVGTDFGSTPITGNGTTHIFAIKVQLSGAMSPMLVGTTPTPDLGGVPASLVYSSGCVFAGMKVSNRALSLGLLRSGALEVTEDNLECGSEPTQSVVTPDGKYLIVANYATDPSSVTSLVAYRIGRSCALEETDRIHHFYASRATDRQEKAHIHGVAVSSRDGLIYASDMGGDLVYIYDLSEAGKFQNVSNATSPAGCGPRHSIVHPFLPVVYVICELDGVVVYKSSKGGRLTQIQTFFIEKAVELLMAPSGKALYIQGYTYLQVFDASTVTGELTEKPTQDFEKGGRSMGLAFDGKMLLMPTKSPNSMTSFRVLQNGSLEEIATITEGLPPSAGTVAAAPYR